MFIDYVIAACDRIIRRAAEENPTARCLQEIPADIYENEVNTEYRKIPNSRFYEQPDD